MTITTFAALAAAPASRKTVILRAFPREILRGDWTVVGGGFANTYQRTTSSPCHALPDGVTEDDVALTYRATIALVDANAGSWTYNQNAGIVYVHPVGTDDPTDHLIVMTHTLAFSNQPDVNLDDIYHEPRLDSAPGLEQEGGRLFWGVSLPTEGSVTLNNLDGFFDDIYAFPWVWFNALVEVYLGGESLPLSEYRVLFKGYVTDSIDLDYSKFKFKLKDQRAKLDTELPNGDSFDSTYPNTEKDWRGSPIPLAYGIVRNAPVVCINGYIKLSKDMTAADTTMHVESLDATYFPTSGTVKIGSEEIRFTGKAASPARLTGLTRGYNSTTAATHDNEDEGELLTGRYYKLAAAACYSLENVYKDGMGVMADVDNITLADAVFRLDQTLVGGEVITADFGGFKDGADLMQNFALVIEDVLTRCGFAAGDLDAASFTAAEAAEPGKYVSLWIGGDPVKGTEILDLLVRSCFGRIYPGFDGLINLDIWTPAPGTGWSEFTDSDYLTYSGPVIRCENVYEKVIVNYDRNWSGKDEDNPYRAAEASFGNAHAFYGGGRTQTVITCERDPIEAQIHAERLAFMAQLPAETYKIKGKMNMADLVIGDRIRLSIRRPYHDLKLFEITAISIDVGDGVDVVLEVEDLHGMGEYCGIWTDDAAPTYAAATDAEKLVSGYWSDELGDITVGDDSTRGKSLFW